MHFQLLWVSFWEQLLSALLSSKSFFQINFVIGDDGETWGWVLWLLFLIMSRRSTKAAYRKKIRDKVYIKIYTISYPDFSCISAQHEVKLSWWSCDLFLRRFVFAWRLDWLAAVIERRLRVGFRHESAIADHRKLRVVTRNPEKRHCVLHWALMTTAVTRYPSPAAPWWHFRGYEFVSRPLSESWIVFHIKKTEEEDGRVTQEGWGSQVACVIGGTDDTACFFFVILNVLLKVKKENRNFFS